MRKIHVKFYCLILMFAMLFVSPAKAYAAENADATDVDMIEMTVPIFDSMNEYQEYLENTPSMVASDDTSASFIAIRDGNTTTCEIYLNWAGTYVISHFRFRSLVFYDAGLLVDKYLGEFTATGLYEYRFTDKSSPVGSVKFGELNNVPLDSVALRVQTNILDAYFPNNGGWISARLGSKLVHFN